MDNLTVDAVAAGELSRDLLATELVEHARERAKHRLGQIEEKVAVAMAAAFVVAAVGAAFLLPAVRPFSPVAAVLAVAAYAIASRVRFEVADGFAAPSQLVLVPMLFVLPPRDVPLLVATGFILGQLHRRTHPLSHTPIDVANAWYSLGPAIVLSLGGGSTPTWSHAPLYLAAFGAQFAVDFVTTSTWSRIAYGVGARDHLRSMRETSLVDAALSPIGLVVAIGTVGRSWGPLTVLPLVWLLFVFAQERQRRLDHAVELSTAYRGTAMLLGEMIEADDEYTGSHSRDVVDLVLAVSDKLDLDPRTRRQAEFAALLHDVGKVKIPAEIINKPGPLDDDERALINTHTILGEEMLGQVGGMLGDIGHVVRSSHERWDGDGYPDGLMGAQIPMAARIVSACDAWSAMTTDRAYRSRLSHDQAVAELRACAGSQFDARVVDALLDVLGV
jgi:HD-GYP domain-containing protein (c-di-GMP phosphodiesterase class II)